MQHPILGILLHPVMGIFALAVACGIVAPMVDKTPSAKIKLLAAMWIAVLLAFPSPEAYLASFMENKKVTYLFQLSREWPLFAVLFGGMSISIYRRWRKQTL